MLNVNQITSSLARMPDAALKQYAQMHKDDPYTVSLAISESNRRKEIRAGSAREQQQPSVADSEISHMDESQVPPQMSRLPEEQGIGALPAPNMQGMAGGGIVAFKDRGEVKAAPSFEEALDMEGVKDPVRRAFLKAIYGQESGSGADTTTSNRGAVGHMQILPSTFKSVADPGMKISNPMDNMRAGIRFASQGYKLAGGDPKLAAAYYYGGPNGLNKAKKGIAVSDPKNPNYPTTLEYANEVSRRMARLKPITGQTAAFPPGEAQAAVEEVNAAAPDKATVLGVVKALGTQEAIKRFGVGVVEDATIGMAGMPADLRKSSATTGVPFLRGLEAVTSALSPNTDKDRYTTESLKQAATRAGLRPEDSPDPNMRAIQTGGEFAGYLTNPVAAGRKLIGGARKGIAALKSKTGSWMDELSGVKPTNELEQARAAQAAADAKIAATRLEAPSRTAPITPAGSPLREQPAPFAVSAEAQAAKEAATKAAAARAAARVSEKPTGLAALEADKLAAKMAGKRVAALESGAAREAGAVNEARGVAASPLQVAPRVVGKDASNLPATFGNVPPEENVPVDVPSDMSRERDSLSRRYPITEKMEPAPQQDDMAREISSLQNRYPAPESQKEVINMAKEETPKTAATKGFTNEDWLNLGFGLLAGKSQHALENLGAAGLGTLAARREREKDERTAALTEAIHTPEAERMIRSLMKEKGLDYSSAMEAYYKNKNYIDTRMYGYDRAATAREAAATTAAGAKTAAAETAAGAKDSAIQETRRKNFLDAIEKNKLLKMVSPAEYQKTLQTIYATYPELAGQEGGASSILPNAQIVGVRPK